MAADRPFVLQWRSTVFASSLPSTAKLVLLTLAEFADRNGANCWPSLPMIAKRASLNERSVRRALDEVEPLGWIQRSKKGSERGWALSVYRLTIPDGADTGSWVDATGPDTESTPQNATCGLSVTEVRTLCHSGVDTESNYLASELSNTQPVKPSPAKRVSQKRAGKVTFRQWLDARPDFPGTHIEKLNNYMQSIQLPDQLEAIFIAEFQRRYLEDPQSKGKKYIDWMAVACNAVRGNWFKLWWLDADGNYQLTAAGNQAMREHGIQAVAYQAGGGRRELLSADEKARLRPEVSLD